MPKLWLYPCGWERSKSFGAREKLPTAALGELTRQPSQARRRAGVADLSRLVFGGLLHVVNDKVINRGLVRLQLESELPLDIRENR